MKNNIPEFQYWNTVDKKMSVSRSIIEWMNAYAQFEWDIQGVGMDVFKDCVWLQYTGQKDAHGDKLYDGDIFEEDAAWYQIEWSEYSGGWDCINIHDGENIALAEFANISTIFKQGNIYENPELLNNG